MTRPAARLAPRWLSTRPQTPWPALAHHLPWKGPPAPARQRGRKALATMSRRRRPSSPAVARPEPRQGRALLPPPTGRPEPRRAAPAHPGRQQQMRPPRRDRAGARGPQIEQVRPGRPPTHRGGPGVPAPPARRCSLAGGRRSASRGVLPVQAPIPAQDSLEARPPPRLRSTAPEPTASGPCPGAGGPCAGGHCPGGHCPGGHCPGVLYAGTPHGRNLHRRGAYHMGAQGGRLRTLSASSSLGLGADSS